MVKKVPSYAIMERPMSKICDRSPCDGLLKALGEYIFGADGKFILQHPQDLEIAETYIDYCPFCGTRLEIVDDLDDS